jgi:hypothetical protein
MIFFAQQKQSGLLLGYNYEIPATTFFSLAYFYQWHRWTGELELEIPFLSKNTLNIGSKSSICYRLLPLKSKVKPYLKTAFEFQNIKLSTNNHKSNLTLGGFLGLGTQINLHKQYSLILEAALGRRHIYYESPVSIWIPSLSTKLKYTISYL